MRLARLTLLRSLLPLLPLLLTACASLPVVAVTADALNVAETAKTGYDMASGVSQRRVLDQELSQDGKAETRLHEILHAQGGALAGITPYVFEGRAYLVGLYRNPGEPERARTLARSVSGVRQVTLCLYPESSARLAVSDGEMRDNIRRLAALRTQDVRVQVVQGNAVLLGSVRTSAERDQLVASARYAGAISVVNHLQLR